MYHLAAKLFRAGLSGLRSIPTAGRFSLTALPVMMLQFALGAAITWAQGPSPATLDLLGVKGADVLKHPGETVQETAVVPPRGVVVPSVWTSGGGLTSKSLSPYVLKVQCRYITTDENLSKVDPDCQVRAEVVAASPPHLLKKILRVGYVMHSSHDKPRELSFVSADKANFSWTSIKTGCWRDRLTASIHLEDGQVVTLSRSVKPTRRGSLNSLKVNFEKMGDDRFDPNRPAPAAPGRGETSLLTLTGSDQDLNEVSMVQYEVWLRPGGFEVFFQKDQSTTPRAFPSPGESYAWDTRDRLASDVSKSATFAMILPSGHSIGVGVTIHFKDGSYF